jgi:hypothetical protein
MSQSLNEICTNGLVEQMWTVGKQLLCKEAGFKGRSNLRFMLQKAWMKPDRQQVLLVKDSARTPRMVNRVWWQNRMNKYSLL